MNNQQNNPGYVPSVMDCAAADVDRAFLETLFTALNDKPEDSIINRYSADTGKCFAEDSSRVIYSVMLELVAQNSRIDVVTLTAALAETNKLEAAGGVEYIKGLSRQDICSLPREARIRLADEKLKIMQNYWAMRAMRKFISTANSLASQQGNTCSHESIAQYLSAGLDRYNQAIAPVVEEDPFLAWIENAKKQKNGECIITRVSSGFKTLDKFLDGGFAQRKLYIIGGRPSMGKSMMGGNIALAAARQDKRVIYFSLEMSHQDIVCRLLADESNINHEKVKNILLANEEEQARLAETALNMSKRKIKINDRSCVTIDDITSYVRKEKATKGVDLVVIDHLHLIASKKGAENRTNEIRQIAGGLLNLAKSAEVPVVALAQLNRETTATMTKMPSLSNLKDGGALEENADAVMMIHRPYYYYDPMTEQEPPPKDRAIIAVQKNRSGMTGTIEMRFEPEYSRFVDANDTPSDPTNDPPNDPIYQPLQNGKTDSNSAGVDFPNGFDLFESIADSY